jgi:hypothetical protein
MEMAQGRQEYMGNWPSTNGLSKSRPKGCVEGVGVGRSNELAGVAARWHSRTHEIEDQETGWDGLCGVRPAARTIQTTAESCAAGRQVVGACATGQWW